MNKPLVSCIMPTMASRSDFYHQAVSCFASQDYPNRELVMVDELPHGEARSWDRSRLLHGTSWQHHLVKAGRSVGAKRNIACSRARGELIVHWDDDDFYTPDRISRQVEQHLQSNAVLSGYHHITFADDENRKAWLYTGSSLYAVGTTLCYWRSHWAAHPFPDLRMGEDNAFLQHAGRVQSSDGRDIVVARIHPGNTVERSAALKLWQQVDYGELARIGYPTK